MLAKLDSYNYLLLPGVIRIYVDGSNDPDMLDILSEINRYNGKIYVEGRYFEYKDNYQFINNGHETYMEIDVVQTA